MNLNDEERKKLIRNELYQEFVYRQIKEDEIDYEGLNEYNLDGRTFTTSGFACRVQRATHIFVEKFDVEFSKENGIESPSMGICVDRISELIELSDEELLEEEFIHGIKP